MTIRIIVAVDSNFSIGYKNKLLFTIPDDLKRFKKITEGNYVVAGRHTFESILNYNNGKPLSNRTNVVLSHNSKYQIPTGVFKFDSVERILNHYNSGSQSKDLMIIGGSSIYDAFMPHVDEVLITYIDAKAQNTDAHFNREVLEKDFYIAESEKNYCEKNDLDFYYVTYKRKLD